MQREGEGEERKTEGKKKRRTRDGQRSLLSLALSRSSPRPEPHGRSSRVEGTPPPLSPFSATQGLKAVHSRLASVALSLSLLFFANSRCSSLSRSLSLSLARSLSVVRLASSPLLCLYAFRRGNPLLAAPDLKKILSSVALSLSSLSGERSAARVGRCGEGPGGETHLLTAERRHCCGRLLSSPCRSLLGRPKWTVACNRPRSFGWQWTAQRWPAALLC